MSENEETAALTTKDEQPMEGRIERRVDGRVSLYSSDDSGLIDDIMEGYGSEIEFSEADL